MKAGGFNIPVPFTPGREDTTQELTDVNSFAVLEPKADGFRNYYGPGAALSPLESLVDRANLLTLTVPEMTAPIGGLRVLDVNAGHSKNGVFTARVGTLSNDYFVNLLDMSTKWQRSSTEGLYEGVDRESGKLKWTATPVDLVFGSHSELRAIAEVYAESGGDRKFAQDFVNAWTSDVARQQSGVRGARVLEAGREVLADEEMERGVVRSSRDVAGRLGRWETSSKTGQASSRHQHDLPHRRPLRQ